MASDRIAVVTVHGTNDTATSLDGEKWFQRGSKFATALLERLGQQHVAAEIVPHLWKGGNSERDREAGARALSRRVRDLHRTHASVHVIGHSHGGNVANEAATMLGWRLVKRAHPQLTSISTVGTPFFRIRLGGSRLMVAFLILSAISILALLAFAAALLLLQPYMHLDAQRYADDLRKLSAATNEPVTAEQLKAYVDQHMQDARRLRALTIVPGVLTPLALIILPIAAYQAVRSIRIQRKQNPGAKIFSIWHPNDEAISFLRRVEALDIEPFKRGAFWRASGTTGLGLGVPAAFLLVLLAAAMSIAAAFGLKIDNDDYAAIGRFLHLPVLSVFGDLSAPELAIVLAVVAVLTPALAFTVVYALTRLVYAIFFELLGRRALNHAVGGALRGMAFGRDGDVRLDAVATHSHNYGVRPLELSGDVENRMRTNSAGAAAALIEKYRWSLFMVDPDRDALKQLSEDAMTWKSLIHTTYFDQPEVVNALADYIAESAERRV